MAQRKSAKAGGGKKNAARKKKTKTQAARAARRPAAPERAPRNIKADIVGLILVALGIFFMACLFQQDAGLLSQSLSGFFRGFFGWGAMCFRSSSFLSAQWSCSIRMSGFLLGYT